MDKGLISGLAVVAGAAIGATVSFMRSWLLHRREVWEQWLSQQALRRQDLYKEFIEAASECYLDALQHHEPNVSLLVVLYAKINQMRVLASSKVLAAAENASRRIVDTYADKDLTLTDSTLRTMVRNGVLDLLHDFGEACRAEFDLLRQKQFERPERRNPSWWRSLQEG